MGRRSCPSATSAPVRRDTGTRIRVTASKLRESALLLSVDGLQILASSPSFQPLVQLLRYCMVFVAMADSNNLTRL